MANFDSSNPTLRDFIESNRAFSLELTQGINGQRKPLTNDIIEAHNTERVKQLTEYINHFHLSTEELEDLLSDKSELDNTQAGWLRISLAETINSEKISQNAKVQIMFNLAAKREGVDLPKNVIDFSKVKGDKILESIFNLSNPAIYKNTILLIANEISSVSKARNSETDNEKNESVRIDALLSATNEPNIETLIYKLAAMSDSVTSFSDQEQKLIQDSLSNILLDSDVKNKVSTLKAKEKINIPEIVSESKGNFDELSGLFSGEDLNLNFTQQLDFARITKGIIQKNKISIDTEHSIFGFLYKDNNIYKDDIAKKAENEKTLTSNISEKAKSIFSKLPFFTKTNDEVIDWNKADYSWHNKDDHFNTINNKPIKKITFKDNEGKPIFIHKPSSFFGNKSGSVYFAKGRIITSEEAILMVSQFIKTNNSSKMFVTPPKHLQTKEQTKQHVEKIIRAAINLGMPIENITVRPNNMIDSQEILKLIEDINHQIDSELIDEFGGLHGDKLDVTSDNENILEVTNPTNDIVEVTKTTNQQSTPTSDEIVEVTQPDKTSNLPRP